MTLFRRWFAWAFLLATIVAQGPHDHIASEAGIAAAEFGACDDPHAHWANHEPSAAGPDYDACSICQHRLQPALIAASVSVPGDPGITALQPFVPILLPTGPLLRSRCRAPPRV